MTVNDYVDAIWRPATSPYPQRTMIVLCYDGSESAKHAVAVAQATLVAKQTTLLHVWTPPFLSADSFGTGGEPPEPSLAEFERFALERAQAVAQQGSELARELNLAVEVRVQRSDSSVWRTILDVADDLSADLIVVGTRGATPVQSSLLGSVSNAIVHHSARSVLVVPRAQQK